MDKALIETALPNNNRMKEYLDNLWLGRWDMSEFNKEGAYWLISCDDLAPKLLPTRPKELREHDSWTSTEKKNTSDKFWRQHNIYNYLEQKQMVLGRNKGMLAKLVEFRGYIPEGDTITLSKFDYYIMMYKQEKEYPENWQDR